MGYKCLDKDCRFGFDEQNKVFLIEGLGKKGGEPELFQYRIEQDRIFEIKIHIGQRKGSHCERLTFFALRAEPSESNGLLSVGSIYIHDPHRVVPQKSYIVIQPQRRTDFEEFLRHMELNVLLGALFKTGNVDDADEVKAIAGRLISKIETSTKDEISTPPHRKRTRGSRRKDNIEDAEVLFVFPLGADDQSIDDAAIGLDEAARVLDSTVESVPAEPQDVGEKVRPRINSLTILSEDRERLEPGVFLNDTLIDFWMQW